MLTIEPGPTGRGRNTAWWAGIANLFWWCDREKGVAGMIASQIVSIRLVEMTHVYHARTSSPRLSYFCADTLQMPFGDMNVMGQWGACEAAVYQAVAQS